MSVGVATAVAAGVKMSSLLGTIAEAVGLLKDIPGAFDALGKIKEAIVNLAKKKSDDIDENSPLGQLVQSEEEDLQRLIEEFKRINKRKDLDAYTKEMHRKRLAAQLCRLFKELQELLKDYIRDYEKLRGFFCSFAAA